MSISRWDPWGDIVSLREAMNQLFEENYARPRGAATGGMGLAVDVRETGDHYVIHTSVPGVRQEDVSISLLGSTIPPAFRWISKSSARTTTDSGPALITKTVHTTQSATSGKSTIICLGAVRLRTMSSSLLHIAAKPAASPLPSHAWKQDMCSCQNGSPDASSN